MIRKGSKISTDSVEKYWIHTRLCYNIDKIGDSYAYTQIFLGRFLTTCQTGSVVIPE